MKIESSTENLPVPPKPRKGDRGPSFQLDAGTGISFDNTDGTYTVRTQGHGQDEPTRSSRDLGRVVTKITTTGRVDAAYLTDKALFLVSGNEYLRFTLTGVGK